MRESIINKIEKMKSLSREEIAEIHGCKPSEVCMGDYIACNTNDKKCPYKVIMGFANFENSRCESLGKLEVVYGRPMEKDESYLTPRQRLKKMFTLDYWGLNIKHSEIKDMGNVRVVYGSLWLNENITSLAKTEYLGSNLYLNRTNVEDFGNTRVIEGRLNIENIKGNLTTLGDNIEKIGLIYIDDLTLESLGSSLKSARIEVGSKISNKLTRELRTKFVEQNGKFIRKELVENLSL